MTEKKDRPIPEEQSTSDRTNLSEKGPDDKSGTRSMHAVPPNRVATQGSRESEPGDENIRSTESKGSGT